MFVADMMYLALCGFIVYQCVVVYPTHKAFCDRRREEALGYMFTDTCMDPVTRSKTAQFNSCDRADDTLSEYRITCQLDRMVRENAVYAFLSDHPYMLFAAIVGLVGLIAKAILSCILQDRQNARQLNLQERTLALMERVEMPREPMYIERPPARQSRVGRRIKFELK